MVVTKRPQPMPFWKRCTLSCREDVGRLGERTGIARSTLVRSRDGPRHLVAEHALVEVTVPVEAPLAGGPAEAARSPGHHPVTRPMERPWARRAGDVRDDQDQRVAVGLSAYRY